MTSRQRQQQSAEAAQRAAEALRQAQSSVERDAAAAGFGASWIRWRGRRTGSSKEEKAQAERIRTLAQAEARGAG